MREKIERYSSVFSFLLLTAVCAPLHADEKVVEIESRTGVTQKFIFINQEHPTAAVVLIPGAWGKLKLSNFFGKPTIDPGYAASFSVESRKEFAKNNMMVAVIDSPSDRSKDGMGWGWRVTEAHARDLEAVVAFLKSQANVPVWLVGNSNAALSAANFVSKIGNGNVHGLALGAAVTNIAPDNPFSSAFGERYPQGAMSMSGLDVFTGPVLVYWHKDDGCVLSPPADAPRFARQFGFSNKVEVKYIDKKAYPLPNSDPCLGGSIHDFQGVYDEASALIVRFILDNSRQVTPRTANQ